MGISAALGSSALLPAGLGFRNVIINGAMTIDQRNAGAAVSTNSAYPVDRWVTSSSTSGAWTFQQLSPTSGTTSSPLPPAGFRSYIKFTKTTGATPAATGQPNYFLQHIEGFNSAQLSWGRSDAKPATLSFWVYSGATGTFGGSLRSTSVNYWSFPFSYTVNSANTWEYKTIQVLPITSGTWYTDNQIGVSLFFDLGSSADYKGTSGAWANSNLIGVTGASQYPTTTSGGYMCWTGVQLEQNYQPTPFEQRPIGVELALCQRYYEKSYDIATAPGTSTGVGLLEAAVLANSLGNPIHNLVFQVQKRSTGYSMTFYRSDGTAGSWTLTRYTSATETNNTMTYDNRGSRSVRVYTTADTAAAREPCRQSGHWVVSDEL
jgi:hypothetical protein